MVFISNGWHWKHASRSSRLAAVTTCDTISLAGGGGEKHDPTWYKDNGEASDSSNLPDGAAKENCLLLQNLSQLLAGLLSVFLCAGIDFVFLCAGIDFMPETKVTKADLKGKKITTQSGEEISYEKLIVALGSTVSPCT